MSSNIPIVRPIAWISLVPQIAFMCLLSYLWLLVGAQEPFFNGASTYLILSLFLKTVILRHHKNGSALVREEKFIEAISHFEKSYDFFKRYDWLDKYRYLTLLSSSKMSYKEMALNNIAFCYSQAGDGGKSKEFYERTLLEFPESGMAKAALRMLNSLDK